jgi:hypothetical protein
MKFFIRENRVSLTNSRVTKRKGNMKKTFYPYVAFIFIAVLVSSCDGPNGPDGRDGNAYVKITSSDGTLNSDATFLSFPPTYYYDQFYATDPGTYAFSFLASYYDSYGDYHSTSWSGIYTITTNSGSPGGEGKPFGQHGHPGADGIDEYYKLDCTYSYGLDIYDNSYLFKSPVVNADTLVEGKVYMRNFTDAKYKIHIECQLKNRSVKKAK